MSKTYFNYGVSWCDIMWQKIPLIFIEGDVKIIQHIYLAMLKDEVLLWVKKTMWCDQGCTQPQKKGADTIPTPFPMWGLCPPQPHIFFSVNCLDYY